MARKFKTDKQRKAAMARLRKAEKRKPATTKYTAAKVRAIHRARRPQSRKADEGQGHQNTKRLKDTTVGSVDNWKRSGGYMDLVGVDDGAVDTVAKKKAKASGPGPRDKPGRVWIVRAMNGKELARFEDEAKADAFARKRFHEEGKDSRVRAYKSGDKPAKGAGGKAPKEKPVETTPKDAPGYVRDKALVAFAHAGKDGLEWDDAVKAVRKAHPKIKSDEDAEEYLNTAMDQGLLYEPRLGQIVMQEDVAKPIRDTEAKAGKKAKVAMKRMAKDAKAAEKEARHARQASDRPDGPSVLPSDRPVAALERNGDLTELWRKATAKGYDYDTEVLEREIEARRKKGTWKDHDEHRLMEERSKAQEKRQSEWNANRDLHEARKLAKARFNDRAYLEAATDARLQSDRLLLLRAREAARTPRRDLDDEITALSQEINRREQVERDKRVAAEKANPGAAYKSAYKSNGKRITSEDMTPDQLEKAKKAAKGAFTDAEKERLAKEFAALKDKDPDLEARKAEAKERWEAKEKASRKAAAVIRKEQRKPWDDRQRRKRKAQSEADGVPPERIPKAKRGLKAAARDEKNHHAEADLHVRKGDDSVTTEYTADGKDKKHRHDLGDVIDGKNGDYDVDAERLSELYRDVDTRKLAPRVKTTAKGNLTLDRRQGYVSMTQRHGPDAANRRKGKKSKGTKPKGPGGSA